MLKIKKIRKTYSTPSFDIDETNNPPTTTFSSFTQSPSTSIPYIKSAKITTPATKTRISSTINQMRTKTVKAINSTTMPTTVKSTSPAIQRATSIILGK